ncbi:DEAD/DEAH box helicase [Clostridium botulinum]|uniref:ATP-dependent RNA helicase DbpA n=1 Tax=Clostridium botulinum TaxID=1491 RepID=A0A846JBZ9_CLOBO|nr:DEAD/DEAH box helicase [Clostridium botulinum]ACA54258.1 ATP-dependent RNA helicase DbpA [Clostridium botulinum A3 str. Loch Maree]NFH67603.1 DEAD/DEAH box helicase [Clostridium botulinum]NFJ10731.1 DEAD/DEAH box helicase [Clostridium botulinum]NFK15269.1 DEAD/DEAH box helicase [Clostridium botulinum]NFM95638.1 DEAD/DEAH box helicase [Clostridium botulinum]
MNKLGFENYELSDEILKSLGRLGYKNPSEVQKQVIPLILKDKDIIVKSETGSGKTAAFSIPICEKIELEEKEPQVLVLTPTRELALQIKEEISSIALYRRLRCTAIFGKQPMNLQKRDLKQRVHLVVGTPGRTLDHIERENLNLKKIKYFVLDEADEMLNMGFIDQVEAVIKRLPKNRVTMLFSATIPEKIENLCKKYMNNPENININPENITTGTINQCYYEVEDKDKFFLLQRIIYKEVVDNSIIFCNTRERVDEVLKHMKKKGFNAIGLHGGMEQKDRLETMKKFKEGEFQFLVCTDVAARGIHIENISHVVNYEMPYEKESYVHRIGRTGRAGKEGVAITFIESNKVRFLKDIEDYIEKEIPKRKEPSLEEVAKGKKIFEENIKNRIKTKVPKDNKKQKDITKIYISAGRKKKIRPGDIVGAITSIEGINVDNIGIIDIQDNHSYVDILEGKGDIVLKASEDMKIKGKKVRIQRAVK